MSELNTMDVLMALAVLKSAANQTGYIITVGDSVTLFDTKSDDEIATDPTNASLIIEKRADLENFIRGL